MAIKFSPKAEMKGRNGITSLGSMDVVSFEKRPDQGWRHAVEFVSRRPTGAAGVVLYLTDMDLVHLHSELGRVMKKEGISWL